MLRAERELRESLAIQLTKSTLRRPNQGGHAMNLLHKTAIASALVLAAAINAPSARADAELDCKLQFDLKTWSAIYKHAEGSGTVTCENGQSMPVVIKARGAGLTVGKSHIDNGHGRFSDIHTIGDVLGNYAQ